MGVFEGLGGWGLGEWLEMSRDLGMQSMAWIGAIWIEFDFSFLIYMIIYGFAPSIPSSTFSIGNDTFIERRGLKS